MKGGFKAETKYGRSQTMDLFEKIGDTILTVGKDVTQKAKDVSGIAKLRLDIRQKKTLSKSSIYRLVRPTMNSAKAKT